MNKKIFGLITGGPLLLKILSGDISHADQNLKSNDSTNKNITVESVIGNVDYPRHQDIDVVRLYLSSFCEQYGQRVEANDDYKIKQIITDLANKDESGKFAKDIERTYNFDEEARKHVDKYLRYFLIGSECDSEELDSLIEDLYNTYNEVAEIAKNTRKKYLDGVPVNKQKDMADLQMIGHYKNISAKPIVILERAIEYANGKLERNIVDDIMFVEGRSVYPLLDERARYLLIREFKEIDDNEKAYRSWVTDIFNSNESLQRIKKTPDEVIKMYDNFYCNLDCEIGDNPLKNTFE